MLADDFTCHEPCLQAMFNVYMKLRSRYKSNYKGRSLFGHIQNGHCTSLTNDTIEVFYTLMSMSAAHYNETKLNELNANICITTCIQ